MRARMALRVAEIAVCTVEIDLRNKPAEMLAASPKGTVPVLCLTDGTVIDESLDIVRWALGVRDPDDWLRGWGDPSAMDLLARTEGEFKRQLDRYKYASRFTEQDPVQAREQAMAVLIAPLASQLQNTAFIGGDRPVVQDMLIFPFVRQFAGVDPKWFDGAVNPAVKRWLRHWLSSDLFLSIMQKTPKP